MINRISESHASGVITPRGAKYYRAVSEHRVGFVPVTTFIQDEKAARLLLVEQGWSPAAPAWRELKQKFDDVTEFTPANIADRYGWNGPIFLFPNGTLIAPQDAERPEVTIQADAALCAAKGSLKGWIKGVARPLKGQSLPMFLIMAAFAAPLSEIIGRHDNPGQEVQGKPGCGKSTLQLLMASVCGAGWRRSANTTLDGVESYMAASNGLPFILDEMNLFYGDEAQARRAPKIKNLAFRMADGQIKNRFNGSKPERYYFTATVSTNELLAEAIAGGNRSSASAAADRLLTLKVAEARQYGVFDSVPAHYDGAELFAKALVEAAERHCGHPMRVFVQGLVNDLHDDREGTIARINANIAKWREGADIGYDNGSLGRVADVFGLYYAAGEEAKRHGVLPDTWWCGRAVKNVYRDFYTGPKAPPSFDRDFRRLLKGPHVRDLDELPIRRMGEALFGKTVFLKTNKQSRQREVLVTRARLDGDMPDWKTRFPSSKSGVKLVREADRQKVKRQVRTGITDRMVTFELPRDFL